MNVKAYGTTAASKELAPMTIERRRVGDDDVSIQIHYCGICHSDIHQARNEWKNTLYPCVPGHEMAGVVLEVGKNVKKFKVGDTVGVGCLVDSCGECSSCREDLENYCENGMTFSYNSEDRFSGGHTFGGYATHVVVKEHFVLKMPTNLDLAAAAPLLCAGITTYSPLKHVGLRAGHKIGVLGLGGLGHMGVKLAVAMGAEVTVLSRSSAKKADAQRMGAQHYLDMSVESEKQKMANHFDFVLDTVSAKHDINEVCNLIKRDGTFIMVGASDVPLDLAVFSLILKRRKMMGSLIGGLKETQDMLDFCAKHNIVCDIEKIDPSQINATYEKILAGKVKYRAVIDCSKF